MKKTILFSIIPAFAIFLFIAAQQPATAPAPVTEDLELGWPDDVMQLLEQSCFDCHTKESGNIKGKGALNFTKWEDYKLTKKIGKLNDISEEVKTQKMPPAKYLKKYPDRTLTDEEITVITNWANTEADKLMEEE